MGFTWEEINDPLGCKADAEEIEDDLARPHHGPYCEDGNVCDSCGFIGAFLDTENERLVCARCLAEEKAECDPWG